MTAVHTSAELHAQRGDADNQQLLGAPRRRGSRRRRRGAPHTIPFNPFTQRWRIIIMSQESSRWLNRNVLIGFTANRGTAWHYRASAQGDEPNHYPGAIPTSEVARRLFDWHAEARPVLVDTPAHGLVTASGKQAITASDTDDVLGLHASGYTIHQYHDWLLEKVEAILDDGLAIGSAGLLKNRAQAWVSVEVPETITTPEGVAFRPNLLACTSHDGSLATTYKRVATAVCCDNTMSAGLREAGHQIKVRHSRHSEFTVLQAREALQMVMTTAQDFEAEVAELCRTEVTETEWQAFVAGHVPDGDTHRAQRSAARKRDRLQKLWVSDQRVTPWRGTAWGVLAAVSTDAHHLATVRGASRAERNLSRAVTGDAAARDQATLTELHRVLAGG
jgi:phage/plasmid-like protein (TIGR03299 family)